MLKSLKTAVLFLTFAMFGDQSTGKYRRILLHNRTMGLSKDISCHKAYVKNDLPAADERSFPEKSIFFLETSCKGGLDSRQACSVESAARANSLWQVNVLFAGPVYGKLRKSLSILHQYKNIKFFRIHPRELAKGTPLDSFLAADPLKTSDWPICHASDILRYLVLYKWGGVYLDLDMIVLRPFDGLGKNWAGQEMGIAGKAEVGSSALAFSRDQLGRKVAAAAVEQIKNDFRGSMWNYNGPGVIFRVLRRLCSTNNPEKMSADRCHGFHLYDASVFSPVNFWNAKQLFDEGHLDQRWSYACHVWSSSTTQHMRVRWGSPYAALAARRCPRVFATGTLFRIQPYDH